MPPRRTPLFPVIMYLVSAVVLTGMAVVQWQAIVYDMPDLPSYSLIMCMICILAAFVSVVGALVNL